MRTNASGGLKLHLGCGPHVVPGWENVDKSPSVFLSRMPWLRQALLRVGILYETQAVGFPRGVKYADVAERIPYPTGAASCIYSSHLIEHLSRWQAVAFVRECARVLAPGAIMRIATPDLRTMASAYLSGCVDGTNGWKTPADSFMGEVNAFHDVQANWPRRMIRRHLSGSIHQWLYDAESLILLLGEGGLPHGQDRSFRVGELPDLDVIETRPESLFVEVRSPT